MFWKWSGGKQFGVALGLFVLVSISVLFYCSEYGLEKAITFALTLVGVTLAFLIAVVQIGMAMQDRVKTREQAAYDLRLKYVDNEKLRTASHRLLEAIEVYRRETPRRPKDALIGDEEDLETVADWFDEMEEQIRSKHVDEEICYEKLYTRFAIVMPALKRYFARVRLNPNRQKEYISLEARFKSWRKRS